MKGEGLVNLERAWENSGLTMDELRWIAEALAKVEGVRRVYLFGSRARGDWTLSSDVDLFVICDLLPGEANIDQMVRCRMALWGAPWSCDVVAADPESFDEMAEEFGSLEWTVKREGVVIYEPKRS